MHGDGFEIDLVGIYPIARIVVEWDSVVESNGWRATEIFLPAIRVRDRIEQAQSASVRRWRSHSGGAAEIGRYSVQGERIVDRPGLVVRCPRDQLSANSPIGIR